MKEIFEADNEIQVLGTRHGEKLYETLLNREEMAKAEDRGGYYRIPADIRDLNYSLYFTEGQVDVSFAEEYTSHNTHRMNQAEMVELLLKLDCVQDALKTRTVSRMNILVTGARGFIGRNLTAHLRAREGCAVTPFDVDHSPDDLRAGLETADIVYHLAGVNRPRSHRGVRDRECGADARHLRAPARTWPHTRDCDVLLRPGRT